MIAREDVALVLSGIALVLSAVATAFTVIEHRNRAPRIVAEFLDGDVVELATYGVSYRVRFKVTNLGDRTALITAATANGRLAAGGEFDRASALDEFRSAVHDTFPETLQLDGRATRVLDFERHLSFSSSENGSQVWQILETIPDMPIKDGGFEILQALTSVLERLPKHSVPEQDQGEAERMEAEGRFPSVLHQQGQACKDFHNALVAECTTLRVRTADGRMYESEPKLSGLFVGWSIPIE